MILTMAWIGLGGYTANVLYKAKHQEELEVKKEWRLVMYRAGVHNKDENSKSDKNLQTYEIQKFIKKEYGYDLVVSIPYGMTYQKLEGIKAELETGLKGDINMHWVKDSQSAYLKVYRRLPDSDIEKVKYDWSQIMTKAGIKNNAGESFKVNNITFKEYGYDMVLNVPFGLNTNKIFEIQDTLESGLQAVLKIQENKYNGTAILQVSNKEFDLYEKWKPVDTKPYEICIGRDLFKNDVIINMNEYPHVLVTGATGTGKSQCMFGIVSNLINKHNDIGLWLAQVSDKKDIQKFKNCKQTQYFAYNLDNSYRMFCHIRKIIKERNIELNKRGLNNIVEYNKLTPNNQWNYHYIVIDELKSFSVDESKNFDVNYNWKVKCNIELQYIIEEARSAGIFILSAIQSPRKENLNTNTKAMYNVKINFRQNNSASARVVSDEPSFVTGLPNRKAYLECGENYYIMTLYLDNSLINKAIKDSIDKNHKYVDISFKKEINENINLGDDTKQTSKKNKQKQGVNKNGIKL